MPYTHRTWNTTGWCGSSREIANACEIDMRVCTNARKLTFVEISTTNTETSTDAIKATAQQQQSKTYFACRLYSIGWLNWRDTQTKSQITQLLYHMLVLIVVYELYSLIYSVCLVIHSDSTQPTEITSQYWNELFDIAKFDT